MKGGKKEDRAKRCAGASQAERTGPLSTTLEEKRWKKRKEWPGKEGETVRDDRRRGEAHVKPFLCELHI